MGSMSPNPDPTDSAEQYVTELGEMVEEYSEGGILSSFNLNFHPPPPKMAKCFIYCSYSQETTTIIQTLLPIRYAYLLPAF